jgi:hypothetical protein
MEPSEKKKKALNSYARYSSVGFQMLLIILGGVFGGRALDHWLDLQFPVFTLVLTILAVVLSIYFVIKDLLRK